MDELETIIAQLLEAEDAGRPLEIDRFLAKYPQHATSLNDFLANREFFRQTVTPPMGSSLEGWATIQGSHSEHANKNRESGANGRTQFGQYELLEVIGRGGMGIVYRARHVALGREVALKMIRAGNWADDSDRLRFQLETEAASRLDHPNIIPVYEVGQSEGQLYYTMKLVRGATLSNHVGSWLKHPRRAVELVVELAEAVHYAHQRGVMHRDLKPANILLESRAGASQDDQSHSELLTGELLQKVRPMVADFGLAKLADRDCSLTQSGTVIGSPGYMAPEQAQGQAHVATTADIYGLGAILYALLTGRPPFARESRQETIRCVLQNQPQSPRSLNRSIDIDLETICLKCLEKKPGERYASAEALADDLQRWLDRRPIRARRIGLAHRFLKWGRRKPLAAGLLAISLVATATTIAMSGLVWHSRGLQHALEIANEERAEADHQRRRAVMLQQKLRYVGTIHHANEAWDAGQAGRALELLESVRPNNSFPELRGFEWYYLWRQCHELHLKTYRFDQGAIRSLAPACGKNQAAIGAEKGLFVFDLGSEDAGSAVRVGDQQAIRSVAFSPRFDAIAAFGEDGRLAVWNWPERTRRFQIQLDKPVPTATSLLCYSPDGSSLLSSCGKTVLLDAISGSERSRLMGEPFANANDLASDGQHAAIVNNDGEVRLWKLPRATIDGPSAGDSKSTELVGRHTVYVRCVRFSPDGLKLASASEDGKIKIWDVQSRQLLQELDVHHGEVYSLAWTRDGAWLAAGAEDGTVTAFRLADGVSQRHPHVAAVRSIATLDDDRLLSAGDDGSIKVWDIYGTTPADVLRGHEGTVRAVSVSPEGRFVASAGNDKIVRIWELATGNLIEELKQHAGNVTDIAFSPDGSELATANAMNVDETENQMPPGYVLLWDAGTWQVRKWLAAHASATWGLAYHPDGRALATAGYTDRNVRIWNCSTGDLTGTFSGLEERNWCVAISPNGKLLASGCASAGNVTRTVALWDLSAGDRMDDSFIDAPWVWSVAFSPDSRWLATGSEGGHVRIWDLADKRAGQAIRGHDSGVRCVAFFPTGATLVSASDDRTIKLWDVATGDERMTLGGHSASVWDIAISSDGSTIVSGSRDGTIRLWRAATEGEVKAQSSIYLP